MADGTNVNTFALLSQPASPLVPIDADFVVVDFTFLACFGCLWTNHCGMVAVPANIASMDTFATLTTQPTTIVVPVHANFSSGGNTGVRRGRTVGFSG
jgi:hypothetical protein